MNVTLPVTQCLIIELGSWGMLILGVMAGIALYLALKYIFIIWKDNK